MSDFNGMALYKEEEIRTSLNNNKKLHNHFNKLLKDAIKLTKSVDTSYRRLGFLWTVKRTAYEDMEVDCSFLYGKYLYMSDWLVDNKYLTEKDREGIKQHVRCFEGEYYQIKHLFNGGKDVYLNPNQAKFVNIYKNIDVEEEMKP